MGSLVVRDPATGAELGRVPAAGAGEVDAAVTAAAGSGWAELGGAERAKLLFRLADLVAERSKELAALQTREQGKPLRESAGLDLPLLAATLFSAAGWADKLAYAGLGPAPRPVGVVAALLPWTAPLSALAAAAAPALACGNPVLLKPAPTTPLAALAFAELCAAAGLPPGTVAVLAGGDDTGRALAAHPGVAAVAYAGSAAGGREVARALAGSGRRLLADVAGAGVNVVFDDAPLASAADGVVDAFLLNAGQGPCAGSRLLVQEPVYDELVAAINRRLGQLRPGDPSDAGTDLGPLHTAERAVAVRAACRRAAEEGAEPWSPGLALPDGGQWLQPVVLTDVAPSCAVARGPIGGPVLAVLSFRTPAEAAALANNPRPRAAGVWTDKGSRAAWLADRLRAAEVWVNAYGRAAPPGPGSLRSYVEGLEGLHPDRRLERGERVGDT